MPAAAVPGPTRPSRRTVVRAAVLVPAASAAGCTLSGPEPEHPRRRAAAPEDPDVALLARVAASTTALVELYEAVAARHRALRADLSPLLAARRAHEDALGQAAPGRRGQPPRRGGRGRDRQSAGTVEVPRRPGAAVRLLADAEREQSARLLDATRQAASGGFAQLLASMSASCAQSSRVLTEAGGR